jgi:VCBS repeat-containing protein
LYSFDTSTYFEQQNTSANFSYSATLVDGSDLPWLSIDSVTGELSGTPTNDDVGLLSITIVATDSLTTNDLYDTFYLTVNNANDAPTIAGKFIGGILTGEETTTGTLEASDVDGYIYFMDVSSQKTSWIDYDYSTGSLEESIYTFTNTNGDTFIKTYYLEDSNGSTVKNLHITLDNGEWQNQVKTTAANGDYTRYYTDSLGTDYTRTYVYNTDGSRNITSSGDYYYHHGMMSSNGSSLRTEDSSGVTTSYSGTSYYDGQLVTSSMDGVGTMSTTLGINWVHRDGLTYSINDQQGTYGTLQLNEQANWTYTFDESSIVNNGQMATDSFNLIVSDGGAEITQQIDVMIDYTPVDAIILTGENQYLHNATLNHIEAPFTINNGELRVVEDSTINTVRFTEAAYDFNDAIEIGDAIDVLRHIVKLEEFTAGSAEFHAADTDNSGSIEIGDAIDILRHIVKLEAIDSFDLIDTTGARVTTLDANATGAAPTWRLVANGDTDLSGSFDAAYVMADIV